MQLIEIGDTRVVQVSPDDSIDHAISLMEQHGFRHLPVVERGRVMGMVSDRDLLSAVAMLPAAERTTSHEGPARIGARRISEIMSCPAHTVRADAPLEAAADLMLRERIRAIPLIYRDHLAGIVTETDFLKCYLDDRPIARRPGWRLEKVAAHMSSPVITLGERDSFIHAVRTMQSKGIRHLPILDNGRLIGIVSNRDLRRVLGGLEIDIQDDARTAGPHRSEVLMGAVMTGEVVSISPDETVAEVADVLVAHRFGSLPVLQDSNLIGIITEADLLRLFVAACKG